MISPYNDDYDPVEQWVEKMCDEVYLKFDRVLGLIGDNLTKERIYKCVFESWREEQPEAIALLKEFSTEEIYLLNFDCELMTDHFLKI